MVEPETPANPSSIHRLVCFDLDGTLLRGDFTLPDSHKEEVFKLREAGFRVTLATGRTYESAKPYMEALEIVEPVIFANGALLDNPLTEERELYRGVPLESAIMLLLLQQGFDLSMKVHLMGGKLYKTKDMPWPSEESHFPVGEIRSDLAAILDEEPVRMVAHGTPAEMERFAARIESVMGPRSPIRLFKSHEYYLEVTDKSVSKGGALALTAERLGFEPEEVIALGDQENDLEMLEGSGLGIQVGSHCLKLSQVADLHLPGPEEEGIKGLTELLLEQLEEESTEEFDDEGISAEEPDGEQ